MVEWTGLDWTGMEWNDQRNVALLWACRPLTLNGFADGNNTLCTMRIDLLYMYSGQGRSQGGAQEAFAPPPFFPALIT